jgi:16S rRNA (guanine966-N2)-methyltransferase
MRIIAGTHRGRLLAAPDTPATRPTADKVRQAIFNVLEHQDWGPIQNGYIADLFCGAGAFGLEALSRGAAHADFIDNNKIAITTTKENAAKLNLMAQCHFHNMEAKKWAAQTSPSPAYTHIFLDPPYRQNLIPPLITVILEKGLAAPEAIFIIEIARQETIEIDRRLALHSTKIYGDTEVRFYIGPAA